MPEDTGGERTIPATPRKRERTREEGNVARSQDLSSAWALGAALLAMMYFGSDMWREMLDSGRFFIGHLDEIVRGAVPVERLAAEAMLFLARSAGPFVIAMLAAGLAINLLQVGVLFTAKPLMPKIERLNPVTGMRKFANVRAFAELVKSLAKLAVAVGIAWLTLSARTREMLFLTLLTPEELIPAVGDLIFAVWWRIVAAMGVIGLLDYGFQRWQYERDIRMTQKEFRDELREMEGDPRIRRRVRQIQRQLAMQRMMAEVPKADVIITNPTHYAVALRYIMDEMTAPVVVAKGARLLAQRIRDVAVESKVPIVERPELARTLYRTVDIGRPIPETLFRAVAEVLSFVYRIDQRTERARERAAALKDARIAV